MTLKLNLTSCSVYGYLGSESVVYQWNDEGPVYGPNGELEVDPENDLCNNSERPVFATCKNNCPGGEFSVITINQHYLL